MRRVQVRGEQGSGKGGKGFRLKVKRVQVRDEKGSDDQGSGQRQEGYR